MSSLDEPDLEDPPAGIRSNTWQQWNPRGCRRIASSIRSASVHFEYEANLWESRADLLQRMVDAHGRDGLLLIYRMIGRQIVRSPDLGPLRLTPEVVTAALAILAEPDRGPA